MQEQIRELVAAAQKIVVVQADNPDADSLGSALALEHILGDLGKDVYLYCGVDVPTYLRYLEGWDRVMNELPSNFDLCIIVDASTYMLFDQLDKTGKMGTLKSKPCIVLDHHATVDKPLDFAKVMLVDPKSASTGELIFALTRQLDWPLNVQAAEHIMSSILGDTQGLMNDLTQAGTYRVMADLTDVGANRPRLEELRREFGKMAPVILQYKGELLKRTEFSAEGQIAHVTIPQAEINEYSPLYNPAPLVQFDMLQVKDVRLSVVFKHYDDGRVTGAIRASNGTPFAAKLAEHMGGGGHDYASGFKVEDGKPFNEVKSECLRYATELLNELQQGTSDEPVQHTFA
ncbi:MAG TPA: DHH family phosphoesterase [Candidatus Saccharimonadales bacterium]|nr:DHH family phosphoesterase [Candidatus Saccharimonadales bacterium]